MSSRIAIVTTYYGFQISLATLRTRYPETDLNHMIETMNTAINHHNNTLTPATTNHPDCLFIKLVNDSYTNDDRHGDTGDTECLVLGVRTNEMATHGKGVLRINTPTDNQVSTISHLKQSCQYLASFHPEIIIYHESS